VPDLEHKLCKINQNLYHRFRIRHNIYMNTGIIMQIWGNMINVFFF